MKRILAILLISILLMSALPLSIPAFAAEGEYILDEIIIGFYPREMFPDKEKQYDDEVDKVRKDGLDSVTDNVYVVKSEDFKKNPNATLNQYKNSKFIEYVEPNYILNVEATPNDPEYKSQNAVLTALNAPEGWEIVTSGSALIAVVDTGFASHSDLPSAQNTYSAVSSLAYNKDSKGHGTQVAGVVGAIGNNSLGIAGINWGANIMAVKVDDANGTLSVANSAKGVIWAADNGAKIINMSFGSQSDSVTMKNAIDYAYSKGCVLVAAAGNEGVSGVSYPARYSNVLAVGASSNGSTRSAASNYGAGLDIVGIGTYKTTTAAGSYTNVSGTSFASPQAAALAALMLELDPSLTNDQIYSLIRQGAKPLGGGANDQTGYGLIDIGKTLSLVQDGVKSTIKDTTPPELTLKGGTALEINQGDAFVDLGYLAIDNADGDITNSVVVTGKVDVNKPGVYKLEYKVTDKAGNTATVTREVKVLAAPAPTPSPTPSATASPAPGATASPAPSAPPGTPPPQSTPAVAMPPSITQIGSSTIILHIGGSPYVEQGATAYDDVDGDISGKVQVSGNVDTSTAGTYTITYLVKNSAGLEATVTREVRVLAPQETALPRIPYDFNDQGKAGASFTHKLEATQDGIVTLTAPAVNKTAYTVTVKDTDGYQVFEETFTNNATRDFWVSAGSYDITMKIDSTNGNTKIAYSLLMPEVITVIFAEAEVPLAELTKPGVDFVALAFAGAALLLLLGVTLFLVKRKRYTH